MNHDHLSGDNEDDSYDAVDYDEEDDEMLGVVSGAGFANNYSSSRKQGQKHHDYMHDDIYDEDEVSYDDYGAQGFTSGESDDNEEY